MKCFAGGIYIPKYIYGNFQTLSRRIVDFLKDFVQYYNKYNGYAINVRTH